MNDEVTDINEILTVINTIQVSLTNDDLQHNRITSILGGQKNTGGEK